jgi:4-hydroxybenzoate polyprenyltransferase
MKLIGAFFRLIRFPNLFFIALTQSLFYYCVILREFGRFPGVELAFRWPHLLVLIVASILIAAAGYIINDYFDLNIDRVNRPGKLVVEKIIKRRWAIIWHWGLSALGILLSFYLGWKIGNIFLGVFNLISVILLWFYSTTFKRQLLIGNIVISLLTAWVVLVFYVCEARIGYAESNPDYFTILTRIFKFVALYGGFAFIISLVREVIKDMEDIEGDSKYNCKTMPIVWGIPAAKVFTAVWIIVLIGALIVVQIYALQLKWWWLVGYSVLLIIVPLTVILKKLFNAKVSEDFNRLSTLVKLVMLTGILSMLFLKWYN